MIERTLAELRDAFEDGNEHFMAAFIEAIQHERERIRKQLNRP